MTGADAPRRVVLVAAVAANGVIGRDGGIPWRIPEDLAHFRATTTGHPVLKGRRTFESIGRPLPGRTTVVLTGDPEWSADGVVVVHTLEQGLAQAVAHGCDVMVAGGSGVYAAAMPHATHQVLTEVHRSVEGDTHYPPFDRAAWRETRREDREEFSWVWLERTVPANR